MKECEHTNKAYNPVSSVLTSMPAIHIQTWICKDCGFEGQDRNTDLYTNEYDETLRKFGKNSNVTFN